MMGGPWSCFQLTHELDQASLIDWFSDTRPQGCTDLQSPVKCLQAGSSWIIGIVSDSICSQARLYRCVRLRNALKCIEMHLGGH